MLIPKARAWARYFGIATIAVVCAVFVIGASSQQGNTSRSIVSTVASTLTLPEGEFKDLNGDGVLNPYEDWRLLPAERADDLLGRMTVEEKAAQMAHLTLYNPRETWFTELNCGFALAYQLLMEGPREAAEWTNQIQSWSEASRLGIPIILSMDSVMGASWVRGATLFPDQIGLAATRDVELVRKLADLQRQEMLALGVRMSLSPVADLGTEPRWGRFQETFGEDVVLVTDMVVAAIQGLQGGMAINETSVLSCVKHFPGSGPQTDGKDGSPILFDDDTLALHLQPFDAAIAAGAWSIMPYGYSTVPFLGGDSVDRPAHESSTVMTELLKNDLGFDGIIQTDWGMRHVDAALAGADILGGAGTRDITRLAEALSSVRLDQSVRKILIAKFEMGLFENPYVDVDAAEEIVGSAAHLELALEAASASLTLLKNDEALPLTEGGTLLVAGALAEDVSALNSGWKCPDPVGVSLLDALARHEDAIVYAKTANDITDELLTDVDTAVVITGEIAYTHEPEWRSDTLDISAEQVALIERIQATGLPMIVIVLVGRPYVLTDVVASADAVLIAYRPGVSQGAEAVAKALYGVQDIDGHLPFQLPLSMESVVDQREDLPGDLESPLFEYGFGLRLEHTSQVVGESEQ